MLGPEARGGRSSPCAAVTEEVARLDALVGPEDMAAGYIWGALARQPEDKEESGKVMGCDQSESSCTRLFRYVRMYVNKFARGLID